MKTLPSRCPLCSGALHVERVGCVACESAIESRFELGWPGSLTTDQLAFVKVFLACRGKIKDVEQALGISYPTVVSRLEAVVAAISDGAPASPRPATTSLDVLDALATGSIDVAEAERQLKKKKR